MEKLLLVDGNALMHRAYHALPPFKTSTGVPTNILFGFLSMLHKCIVDFQPNHLLVCFDTPARTFRNDLLESYQAQRPKIDDDFIVQIPFVKKALDAAKIIHMEKDGFEADDLIGTITHHYKKNGIQVFILSGDKDILQLVEQNIFVISPQIGFAKTKVYTPLEEKEKIKKILQSNLDNIQVAKKLATIVKDVPLEFDLEKTHFSWFHEDLKEYLVRFEMNSIIKRIFERKQIQTQIKPEPKPQMTLF